MEGPQNIPKCTQCGQTMKIIGYNDDGVPLVRCENEECDVVKLRRSKELLHLIEDAKRRRALMAKLRKT